MTFKEFEFQCKNLQHKANYKLNPHKPIIVHCDGRSFSKIIKNRFKKPFDNDFIELMNNAACYAAKSIQGCKFAYVQSDEITFCIINNPESDGFFGCRLCKMQSIIASLVTSYFVAQYLKLLQKDNIDVDIDKVLVQFDCKCWNVDSIEDVMDWFIYRQMDCIRNSKQQTAQSYLPHKRLLNLSCDKQIELLQTEKGISWENDIDAGCKYGRLIHKSYENHSEYQEYAKAYVEYIRTIWVPEAAPILDRQPGNILNELIEN
jgi:tRNA(His) 5'-end guanylyltransferase